MYESSDSQYFKFTIRIQSGPDTFDDSRFVITFLTMFESYINIMQFQISYRSEKKQRDTRIIKIRVLK